MPHRARIIAWPPAVVSPPAALPPSLFALPSPRSARLGSTIPSFAAWSSLSPTSSDAKPDSPPLTVPLHPSAPDIDVEVAAVNLSETLVSCGHRDWEQMQQNDPLCDEARQNHKLGSLSLSYLPSATTLPLRTCLIPQTNFIFPSKAVESTGTTTHYYWCTNPQQPVPLAGPSLVTPPPRIYGPLLARP